MSLRNGALLWRRMRVTVPAVGPDPFIVDTGVTQPNLSFPAGEPPLGVVSAVPIADGVGPASRVQILPQSPLGAWANMTHSEPYVDSTTKTIHLVFVNSGEVSVEINFFVFDPHTSISPGQADTYHGLQ